MTDLPHERSWGQKNSLTGGHNLAADMPASATDDSGAPIGHISDVLGHATISRGDGRRETVSPGTDVHRNDFIDTDGHSTVDIQFVDHTSFTVTAHSHLKIDDYIFDAKDYHPESAYFSWLHSLFSFTDGLIEQYSGDHNGTDAAPLPAARISGTTDHESMILKPDDIFHLVQAGADSLFLLEISQDAATDSLNPLLFDHANAIIL